MKKKLLFVTNVDWYYNLHWKERIFSKMTSDFDVSVSYSITEEKISEHPPELLPLSIQRSSISLFSNVISFVNAAVILINNHFDLIHSATVKPNLYFGFLARIYSIPILITIPGLGTVFSSQEMNCKPLQQFIRFLYRFAGKNIKSHFIFENKEDRKYFLDRKICSLKNSTVVSGAGVDLELFRYAEEKGSNSTPIKLLFAARLLKGKGLEDLILATESINISGRLVELDVAGIVDNDSRESIPLYQIESWHNNGKINYLGQVEDMPELLSRTHIVALPTTYGEGLPRILLEANACGRPIITTDIPGCNDFVEDSLNGILINPGCVDELEKAIKRLLDKKNRIKMGHAGRARVEQFYSKEHVIDQYRVIYKKLTQQCR